MPVETFDKIDSLNASNPVGATDPKSQGDDHIRGIKSTLLATFPNIAGAVTLTHTQINDAAQKAVSNTFLAAQRIEASNAGLFLKETDAPVDNKTWQLRANNQNLSLFAVNDAESTFNAVVSIERTGASVDSLAVLNGAGITRLSVRNAGKVAIHSDGSLDTENRELVLLHQDLTERASFGHQGGSRLDIINRIHGANIALIGEDAGGTARNLLEGDPDGQLLLYYAGTLRLETRSAGQVALRSDGNTDTEERRFNFYHANGTTRAFVGHNGDGVLRLRNMVHGSDVRIEAEDLAGSLNILFNGDPDGSASMYHAGTLTFRTIGAGNVEIRGDLASSSDQRRLDFVDSIGNLYGFIGHNGGTLFEIQNRIHGANLSITCEDAGGTIRTILTGDPDGATVIRGDTTVSIQVDAAATYAVQCQTDGGILTPNAVADEFGFKGAPRETQNSNYTFVLGDAGKQIRKASGGAGETFTIPANSSVAFPIGTIIIVVNDGGGDLSIAITTDTLEEYNSGLTGTRTLPDNNKAILEKVDTTLWKYSATG